ncbi:HNH endonuclease signature motif containing protein [Streptomyces sp. LBL]|uniref:HNH endonuclease n=1 Tax=Streptomyces sp. LBL TaxID=2940562 RepID=UPI00247409A2|nr:HNH endonuclease signature motif containing protein [Streptomyces sp. LBL]
MRAASQRRRASIAEATIETFTARDLRHDWEDHDLYACFFCGGFLVDGYEVEHFYPLSKGGPHALFNLLPSCAPCNRGVNGKHSREPWQFLREALADQGTELDACLASIDAIAARRRP